MTLNAAHCWEISRLKENARKKGLYWHARVVEVNGPKSGTWDGENRLLFRLDTEGNAQPVT